MAVLKVENLGKKYLIGHDKNAGGAYRYSSIRDSIAHSTRGIYQRIRHPLSPNTENIEIEEFWALKNINFEINQGDRIGIIGHNGAGKTTLLKLLSRITHPTIGSIKIKGRIASLLEVGTGFHPELSGRENIYLNGAILGMKRIEIKEKFDEIVAFAEVEKFLDTPVKRYSSGMYVRLAFAVAAHLEPEILIVDEVLAVGDAAFQKKSLGKMEDISKEGRTILFVSHNMEAIRSLTQKTIYLKNGRVNNIGNTTEIIKTYMSSMFSLEENIRKLDNYHRSDHLLSQVYFDDITINNSNNIAMINIGDPIIIKFKIITKKDISNANISLGILNNEYQSLFSIHSPDSNFYISNIKSGIIECCCKISSVYFMPGRYFIGAGINQSDRSTAWDVLLNYPAFEILNEGEFTINSYLNRNENLVIKADWDNLNE